LPSLPLARLSFTLMDTPPSADGMQALLSCSSAFTPESTQPGVDPDSSVTSSHVRSSYVDELLREFDKGQFGAPERVWVREGDRVLWPAEFRARLGTRPLSSTKGGDGDTSKAGIARHAADTPPLFAVMKLDVEGFECNTLRGMSALLSAGAVRTIKTEVFDNALRAQGCSGIELQRLLTTFGFFLFRSFVALEHTGCFTSLQPPSTKSPQGNSPYRRLLAPISPNFLYGAANRPYSLYALHCRPGALVGSSNPSRPRSTAIKPKTSSVINSL